VGNQKKPWEDVPIEVLIEDERKRKKRLEDHREHLHAPSPLPPFYADLDIEEEDEHKIIIIKL
jgi:hypothetical protein